MKASLRDHWNTDGYTVMRSVYDTERAARLLPICEAILEQWRVRNPENDQPGGGVGTRVMRHLNHPGYFIDHPSWKAEILEAAADECVLDMAQTIFNEEPLFRCISFLFNPLENSHDGNWHRDSQFMTPDDQTERVFLQERAGTNPGMQMQIALTPSDDIEFVPGSHLRWDTAEEYYIRKADDEAHNRSKDMPDALRLALEPGDAVLFNPMGLHRGRYHTDKRRRTLMLTFTRLSTPHHDYFSHQPWFLEPGYLDGVKLSAQRFFQRFVETYRSEWLRAGWS